jgi:DNA modification methylase
MAFSESVMVKLNKLKPDKKNARKHSERNIDEIARSLREFGQHRHFVVQRGTNRILVGNGMYEAMKRLGWTEGLALFVDDDDEAAAKRALADNRTGELAEWDWPVLKDIVQELGPEPDIPGWSDEELEGLFDLSGWNQNRNGEEEECPGTPEAPVSKPGEIWICGDHRVMCGDATSAATFGQLMGGARADMVFADPPYNVDYSSKNTFLNQIDMGCRIQKEIEGDKQESDLICGKQLWFPSFKNAYDFADDYCSLYVTMPQGGAHMMMMMMMIHEANWQVKHELIWVKNNHVLGRADYNYKHEPILFGWKNKHKFYGKGEFLTSVWEIDKLLKNDLHPTMKPVKLVENAILNSSKKSDIILDPFGGSGTTLVACEQTGRVCYMAELSPRYCDVIVKRWEDFTGKKAELST